MKVYFCGSIRGGRDDVDLYLRIVTKLKSFATVLTEHVSQRELGDAGQSPPGPQRGSSTNHSTNVLHVLVCTESDALMTRCSRGVCDACVVVGQESTRPWGTGSFTTGIWSGCGRPMVSYRSPPIDLFLTSPGGDLWPLGVCSVVVAEVTQPSLGVGYELGRAVDMKKKVFCLFRPSGRREATSCLGKIKGTDTKASVPFPLWLQGCRRWSGEPRTETRLWSETTLKTTWRKFWTSSSPTWNRLKCDNFDAFLLVGSRLKAK